MDTVSKIGRYEILSELGHGAMGTVYRAKDPAMDRVVALERVTPQHRQNGVNDLGAGVGLLTLVARRQLRLDRRSRARVQLHKGLRHFGNRDELPRAGAHGMFTKVGRWLLGHDRGDRHGQQLGEDCQRLGEGDDDRAVVRCRESS